MFCKSLTAAVTLSLICACLSQAEAATYQVVNNQDSGTGSLRAAIDQANNNAGADTITFAIGTGAKTITLLSPLPALTGATTTLDAETQPGSNGTPLIRIDGVNAGPDADGIRLQDGPHAVRGLVVTRFSRDGFRIIGNNHVVVGNFIGVGHDGLADLGNGANGVYILGSGNYIGGTLANQRNVISGNTSSGIVSFGDQGNNIIINNRIGTDVSGLIAVPNSEGVYLASPDNVVGGDGPQYRNIISGNSGSGLIVYANNNKAYGNYIGLGPNGTTTVANGSHGVLVYGNDAEIGGLGQKGNVISGNGGHGIYIRFVSNGSIRGNLIGLNAPGLSASANLGNGIYADRCASLVINANLIGGNGDHGLYAIGDTAANHRVEFYSNIVGINASGNGTVPNQGHGLELRDLHGNSLIGGVVAGVARPNIIGGNAGHGIHLVDASNIVIESNRVGVGSNGASPFPNGQSGIEIQHSSAVQVGGDTSLKGNIVSGNSANGIGLNYGTEATLRRNLVGLDATGTLDVGNAGRGIAIGYGPNVISLGELGNGNFVGGNGGAGIEVIEGVVDIVSNFVGTNQAGNAALANQGGIGIVGPATVSVDSNLISGNTSDGIQVNDPDAVVEILGNRIGTNINGTAAVPNTSAMRIVQAAPGLKLGAPDLGNLISGNNRGVTFDPTTQGFIVQGNVFGLNSAGNALVGNGEWALGLDGIGHQVGGGLSERNIFAGNGSAMRIAGQQHVIQGNVIGTNANGAAGLGNYDGIVIADAEQLLIGGDAGFGNTIVNSTAQGIRIENGQRNAILGNLIHHNAAYAIDLLPENGTTPNDLLDTDQGPNQRQNFPVILSASIVGANLNIEGVIDSKANTDYRIELFHTSACHVTGFGQSESYLGLVNVLTDGQGHALISKLISNGPTAGFVTATATDPLGNTSEFGPCMAIGAPSPGELNFDRLWTMTYEDLGVAEVVVTRSKGLLGTVTAQFATANNSAQAGQDYQATSQTLVFGPGESSKVVTVPLISDGPGEAMEDFDIHLTAPTGGVSLGSLKDARVAIYEQDANNVHGSIEDVVVAEPANGQVAATFTVTIGSNPSVRTIQYATEDGTATAGSDYVATSGSLSFQPGQTSKTVSVMVRADGLLEDGEYFTLKLTESDPTFSLLRDAAVAAIANTGGAMILFGDSFED